MQTSRQLPLSFAQRAVLVGLLLCMALAQSFAFAHRTLHHNARTSAHAIEEHHAGQHAGSHDDDVGSAHGMPSRLFASHDEGDETCRLIDSANAFIDANSHVAGVLSSQYAPVLVAFDAAALAAWRAPLFEARGPPVHSL